LKASVLVAIPFKNKSDLTISCLESLIRSYVSGLTYEILLISDGSKNEEINNVLKNNPYGNTIQLKKQQNVGYTKTIYDVVEYAKKRGFDYLLLSNNDIKFLHGTLYSLVKKISSNPNIANVGCKILHWTDDVIIHTGTRINKKCENWIENPYCGLSPDDPIVNFSERRLWNNGCCSIYNLDILRKENMNFDLSFSIYFEESDLMTRFNLKGYSVLYEPRSIVRHKVNATVGDDIEKYGPIFNKNWELYLSKWKKYFNSKMLYFQEGI